VVTSGGETGQASTPPAAEAARHSKQTDATPPEQSSTRPLVAEGPEVDRGPGDFVKADTGRDLYGYGLGVADGQVPDQKRMRLRYAGVCRVCGAALTAKSEAIYERSTKTVRCTHHADRGVYELELAGEVDAGTPGASARREFERRRAAREQRIREKHPRMGGLIHALSDDPQSTRAWDIGATGEERLGNRLNELTSETLRVLHDRRIPGSRANIDHLAVTPAGVYVIDAKKYQGRPRLRIEGGLLRTRVERLTVGSRDCTKVVDGVLHQVDVVRSVVGDAVPVHGVLCFVDADWPMVGGAFRTRGVEVLWPKKLYQRLTAGGAASTETICDNHRLIGSALPPA
jgi:hypothetical protein